MFLLTCSFPVKKSSHRLLPPHLSGASQDLEQLRRSLLQLGPVAVAVNSKMLGAVAADGLGGGFGCVCLKEKTFFLSKQKQIVEIVDFSKAKKNELKNNMFLKKCLFQEDSKTFVV